MRADAGHALEIVESLGQEPVAALVLSTKQPFFVNQQKIVLENSGVIDPERIEDYISAEGYQALIRALTEMTPREVVEQVMASGLRGRGGAGFLTGLKWEFLRKAVGERKYISQYVPLR